MFIAFYAYAGSPHRYSIVIFAMSWPGASPSLHCHRGAPAYSRWYLFYSILFRCALAESLNFGFIRPELAVKRILSINLCLRGRLEYFGRSINLEENKHSARVILHKFVCKDCHLGRKTRK